LFLFTAEASENAESEEEENEEEETDSPRRTWRAQRKKR
jgi:hypothetical protein